MHSRVRADGPPDTDLHVQWAVEQPRAKLFAQAVLQVGVPFRVSTQCLGSNLCERVTFLDRIPEVQNGYVVDKTREYYYGDEARVQCYKGYRLIGSHTVKCNEQQDFSNVPVCEGRSGTGGRATAMPRC